MIRLRRPRCSVRTLLALAAVAGLLLGLEGMRRRRASCLERAAYHRRVGGGHGNLQVVRRSRAALASRRQLQYRAIREGRDPASIPRPPEPTEAERAAFEDECARDDPHYGWHLRWIRRFERAAARPWLAVPTESEEPVELLNANNWSI